MLFKKKSLRLLWVGLGWTGFIGLTVKSNGVENDRFSAY